MRNRKLVFFVGILCLAVGGLFLHWITVQPAVHAQQPGPGADVGVIRAESRLVLVDTVVTDKKGNYIRDLAQEDFKVWEDGKEQALSSFSFEESTGAPDSKPRYMVLFFDNSTMDVGDQASARTAAAKFIDANAGPNRLIAIAEFGGTVRITQNFTADAARLKQVVSGFKGSSVSPNGEPPVMVASLGSPPAAPSLNNAEAEFGIRSVLLAMRSLAKSMSTVPGRKTLVMLTSGFPLTPTTQSELTAVIDTCNKSNVAIYPIDVRGLAPPAMSGPHGSLTRPSLHSPSATFTPAVFHSSTHRSHHSMLHFAAFAEPAFSPQHGGGGGGGHGGPPPPPPTGGGGGKGTGGGGGTTGTGGKTGGGTPPPTTSYNSNYNNAYTQSRQIVPQFPPSASNNQQVLYQLADGTGGFVILNTNDLLGGLDRIAKDQNQYYLLGYKPAASLEGACHSLKVKVERGGTIVRARSGYCNIKPNDLLAGNPIEKDLETRAGGEMKGNVSASMQAPFFYSSANIAQVHLAVEIPSAALKFEKVKGKQHASLNILGIAYKSDNSISARFSDTVNLDLDGKKEVEDFQREPYRYENQFDIAPGAYVLKVVFSSGNASFGKLETPLLIDAYQGTEFSMSGIALSNSIHRAADAATALDGQLLEDRTPLLVKGMQISPSASNHFKKTDVAAVYAEIYDPLLKKDNPPDVAFEMTVVERKSGQVKLHVGERTSKENAGNPMIALGLKLPVATLDPGSYRVDLRAVDSTGQSTKTRSAEFEVE